MDKSLHTDGIVESADSIRVQGLPYDIGQKVEVTIKPITGKAAIPDATKKAIADRVASFRGMLDWMEANLPKNLPILSESAISRESVYEGRGL